MIATMLGAGLLAGCNDTPEEATTSTVPDPAPRVDVDPTPPSTTGGGTEAITPDGTSNGAPAETSAQPQ